MDGTLVDSSEIITNSINHVRSKIGLAPMAKEPLLSGVNDPAIHPPQFFYNHDAYTPEHVQWFKEYYDANHHNEVALYAGIKETLQALQADFKLSLATNAYRDSATQILTHLDIAHYFEIIVGADEVDEPKPAPDMLLKIIDFFGCAKEEAVLVGDSHKDMLAAQNAQIASILVNWGFSKDIDGVETIEHLKQRLYEGR